MLMLSALAMLAVLHTNASAISRYGVDTFGPLAADQQDSFLRWLLYFSPYVRIFEFLLGCLTASIYVQLKPGRAGGQIFGAWLTAAALASVALSYWAMFSGVGGRWQPFLLSLHMNFGFAPSMALLIFCCASFDNAFSRLMSARLAVLCGEASYSIYLLHFLIVSAFHHEAPIIVSRRQIAGSALQLVVVLAAIMGLSLISWATIEVPARRWIRRRLTLALAHPNAPRSP
jgi:peptidoglycan/LPS O-acetylase OafA/YrhL